MLEIFLYTENSVLKNPKVLETALKSLQDGRYLVKFQPYKIRSLNQNAYFHAVMVPMVKEGLVEAGFHEVKTDKDAKDVIKAIFLKKIIQSSKLITNGMNHGLEVTKDTSELTTLEFAELIDRVIEWAAEYLGIEIPLPGEQMQVL